MREQTLNDVLSLIIEHEYGDMSDDQFEKELDNIPLSDKVTLGETANALVKVLSGLSRTIETLTEVQEERYRVLVESLPEEYQENIRLKLKESQDDILDVLDEGDEN
ncbi:hypothetical protein [Bacillus phage SDFMU_Pbc]|uniref:Uncharacterized protein n=1 Tax=Bacillus phage SDFMU_Pbc TaxID=3076135 RepID=A0AA96R164_9CAUD|nr:hypothetical protein [Bacillus phage SDFMU_Pbc]